MKYFLAITYLLGAFIFFRWGEREDYFGLSLFLGWWLAWILYYLNRDSVASWAESKIRKTIAERNVWEYLEFSGRLKKLMPWLILTSASFVILKTYATEGYCAAYLSSNPSGSELNALMALACAFEPLVPRNAVAMLLPYREDFFIGTVASLIWCLAIGFNWLLANCVSGMTENSGTGTSSANVSFLVAMLFGLVPWVFVLVRLIFL